jgi:glyoxylase-like metal-dependent hydrolase (beta-lactamase superfamily II)
MWSVFSDERQMDFNGYLIETAPHQAFIVDPPCAGPEVLDGFEPLPKAAFIFLTNADHQRAAEDFRTRFKIPIYVHELDAPRLSLKPDFMVQDGHEFANGWQLIHLPHQKTPGESALYSQIQQMLLLGDALIGQPYQQLSMLPPEKYLNRQAAFLALQNRLNGLSVQAILPGDGDPILLEAGSILRDTLTDRNEAD